MNKKELLTNIVNELLSKKEENKRGFISVEPMPRVELGTFSLPSKTFKK